MPRRAKPSPLRRAQRSQIVDLILDATEEVAIETGVDGITIVQIATRAGVAVGTLYNYFPKGTGIVAALFKKRTGQLLPLVLAAAEATNKLPFEQRLRAFVSKLLVAYQSHIKFLRVAGQVDRRGMKSKNRDNRLADATAKAFEDILRDGAKRKHVAADRALIYARMIHGALRAMLVWRLGDGSSLDVDADVLVDTFLRGMT